MIIKKKNKSISEENQQAKSSNLAPIKVEKEEKIDLFDIENIDFTQRQERRRGDRRRGYRRIDDRNLISRAQEEAETIKDSAAKEGYEEGLRRAQADIQALKEAILTFQNSKQEIFEYIAPDILEISVDIARKIVKKEIEQDPQIVLNSILDVLKTISKDESRINIRVNPIQAEMVKKELPEIISAAGIETKVRVVSDESVYEGSCIVYTNNGIVDASVDTQLEIIKEALKGV